MSEFIVYLKLGWFHIADFSAYDHMLFLLALCGVYQIHQYKTLIGLITAFTLGHSITLALAANHWVVFSASVIEFLIPTTILFTALFNVFVIASRKKEQLWVKYLVTTFFGLIHGLGFSTYLSQLLGSESSIIKPLFAFNVGIELGQLLIVAIILLVGWAMNSLLQTRFKYYQYAISSFAGAIAVSLMYNTKFW